MTDRELLERAARAAGMQFRWCTETGSKNGYARARTPADHDAFPIWNPLTDDGDALRLAVRVLNWPHGGRAFDDAVTAMFAVGELPKDPYAATRRAIVRAAAAMEPK
jgi:hypothetical protein